MEAVIIIVAILLILGGLAGSILPVIPGPPIAYGGILLTHFFTDIHFSTTALLLYAVFTALILAVDYIIPAYWVKKTGGTKWGSNGSIIGMLVGMFFFPPIGMLLGTFAGAVIGEMLAKQSTEVALKSGIATFFGFLAGTFLKVSFCLLILIHLIIKLF